VTPCSWNFASSREFVEESPRGCVGAEISRENSKRIEIQRSRIEY
jgi:hypothetical protein